MDKYFGEIMEIVKTLNENENEPNLSEKFNSLQDLSVLHEALLKL